MEPKNEQTDLDRALDGPPPIAEKKSDDTGHVIRYPKLDVKYSEPVDDGLRFLAESREVADIYSALAAAQGQVGEIRKDSTAKVEMKAGGSYTFNYAGLPAVIAAIKKPMADNGLAIIFTLGKVSGSSMVIGKLVHKSGQWIQVAHPFIIQPNARMQDMGSGKTYARRYILQDLFDICAEEDDDAGAASGDKTTVSPKISPITTAPRPKPAASKSDFPT